MLGRSLLASGLILGMLAGGPYSITAAPAPTRNVPWSSSAATLQDVTGLEWAGIDHLVGADVSVLGEATTPSMYGEEAPMITLQRIPIPPYQSIDGRDPSLPDPDNFSSHSLLGAHLIVVERGAVVVSTPEGEQSAGEGTSVYVPGVPRRYQEQDIVPYRVRNDTGGCATILRLTYVPIAPASGGLPPGPGPELSCGEPETLLTVRQRYQMNTWSRQAELQMVIARIDGSSTAQVRLTGGSTEGANGLVGWFVDAGLLGVGFEHAGASIGPGGSVAIEAGTPYSVGDGLPGKYGELGAYVVGVVAP